MFLKHRRINNVKKFRSCSELRSPTPVLISNASPQSSESTLLSFDDQLLSGHQTENQIENQIEVEPDQLRPAVVQIGRLDNQIGHLSNQIAQTSDSVERSRLLGEVVVVPPSSSNSSIQILTNLSPASGDYQPVITRIPIRSHCQTSVNTPTSW